MPRIEIDDEVYRALQARATPFLDDPNAVVRRLLQLDDSCEGRAPGRRDPSERGAEGSHSTDPEGVAALRKRAIMLIEEALASRGLRTGVVRRPGAGQRLSQRYETPNGLNIYLRTRSFDANHEPFFTVLPSTLDDADFYVFVCGGRGTIVMAAAEVAELADGLHVHAESGDLKPTFVVSGGQAQVYAYGGLRDVSQGLEAFPRIAAAEGGSTA